MSWPGLWNLGLVVLFGLQHSLLARAWWKRLVPVKRQRLLYVASTFAVLGLMAWLWKPMPVVLWLMEGWVALGLYGVWTFGLQLILFGAMAIEWRELVGLREPGPAEFRTPFLYTLVRHPIYLGTILVLWATPKMTQGRMLFASAMTLYIFVGIYFEERDLVRRFGDVYRVYQQRVPMLLPRWPR